MAGRRRYIDYQTTLPTSGGGLSSRRILASIASVTFHIVLVVAAIRFTTQQAAEARAADQPAATERPIQLLFEAPAPAPRPEPQPVEPPAPSEPLTPPPAPLTPGESQTPGSNARVVDEPEPDPNAAPDARRENATRPDPGDADTPSPDRNATATESPLATSTAPPQPTAESEARRIFGRPSALLGPAAGTRSSRPWETNQPSSDGCKLPPEEESDSTVPKGMAVVQGRIFREDNGRPLSGARLQILGTQFGTFSNDEGYYRLLFDRTLVDRCRTQSVRVTAPGYRGRDVILYLGERASSDVSLPRW